VGNSIISGHYFIRLSLAVGSLGHINVAH